ncbi:hypothetical protein BHU61_04285 [Macrococcus epidermidis]|uniref:Uncharacterized protein n=1 Tax=Macrococcus epidermidis TaxID=1902580 RepID=A0A327ZX75_9STAP|nr:sigma-70 family RNA polymerase sigma factor [Macrococcus epidermidis]RAK46686.1 hypothetical protein BHU61_04285 [Macrococcus epidermidis]UTH15112.1 sigma-70 family RNA polymerase sigma factor [Macrococcus epidermidis]
MLSLFVMDVSGSTKYDNSEAISNALVNLTDEIEQWTKDVSFKYINFRMGDELFFVSDSLSATLLTSYYIKLLWPYKSQPIKFGIAASNEEIPTGNLEHWNAPIIKQARRNLTQIKQSDITDFHLTIEEQDVTVINNVLYPYLTEIVHNHSEMQQQVLLLSYVYDQQKEIAQILGKGLSTISEHLKKSHKKQLMLIEAALKKLDNDNHISLHVTNTFKEYALC